MARRAEEGRGALLAAPAEPGEDDAQEPVAPSAGEPAPARASSAAPATAAGLSLSQDIAAVQHARASAEEEWRKLQATLRSEKLLLTALSATDAETIASACLEAEAAGVSQEMVGAARDRLRRLREASLLACATRDSEPAEIERECDKAEQAGIDANLVAAARERARRLRETRLLAAATSGSDAAGLERACLEATLAGVSASTVDQVRQRIRQLREERMLAVAFDQSATAEELERACAEAERSGADARAVAAARRRASQLREERSSRLAWRASQVLFALQRLAQEEADSHDSREDTRGGGYSAAEVEQILEAGAARFSVAGASQACSTCSICLEPLSGEGAREPPCTLPCLHTFHRDCAGAWLPHQGTCPNCRVRVGEDHEDVDS